MGTPDPNSQGKLEELRREVLAGVLRGDFEQADLIVQSAGLGLAAPDFLLETYEQALASMVKAGMLQTDRKRVEAAFHRANYHAFQRYPTPDTRTEADAMEAELGVVRRRMEAVLGYTP
jgi:hypothetical protein